MKTTATLACLALASGLVVGGADTADAATSCPTVATHRGDTTAHTENTLPAMRAAYAHGAESVEVDIRWTRDGYAMAMHDRTLARTTNGTGYIANRKRRYVRSLRTDDGYRVPFLTGVLRKARDAGRDVMLEIKPTMTRAQAALVVRRVREYGLVRRVTVASFAESNLRKIENRAPRIRTAHFDGTGAWGSAATGGWDVYGLVTAAPDPTPDQVAWAHTRGLEVLATGNTTVEWQTFADTSVDEVITDVTTAYLAWRTTVCG